MMMMMTTTTMMMMMMTMMTLMTMMMMMTTGLATKDVEGGKGRTKREARGGGIRIKVGDAILSRK